MSEVAAHHGTSSLGDTREAVTIAAWGLLASAGYMLLTSMLQWLDAPMLPIVALLGGLASLNFALARATWQWADRAWVAWAYEAGHALALTVLLYLSGGSSIGIFIIVYASLVLHTEILRPDASVFVTANVCAALYAALSFLEYAGWVQSPHGAFVAVSVEQRLLLTSFTFLALNFLALYASRHGRQLRRLATRLRQRSDELRRANHRLAATAAALEEKQREVRTFVYAVTHDLKAPLNAIGLRTDLVLEAGADRLTSDQRDHLDEVLRAVDRTEGMIRDLLEMFRVTSLAEPAAWVDLTELMRTTVEQIRPQIAAKQVRVEVEALPIVWGQRRKLAHVMTNLIGNAVKYVPADGGRVVIRATVRNGDAVLSISDNGIGIDPVHHRRIFEPFGRAPADARRVDGHDVPGSGIGLTIVRQIVEAQGGQVWVESAAGAGATFHLRLARRADAPPASADPDEDAR